MNIDKLNPWLSLCANVGVVIGIIFLAMEVRHASNATELQTIETVTDGWMQMNLAVVSDPQVARAWIVGHYDPDQLSTVEAAQYAMHLRMFENHVYRIRRLHDLGLVPDADLEGARQNWARYLSTPGGQQYSESNNFDPRSIDGLRPYMDPEPTIGHLLLGRDPSTIE